MQDSSRMKTFEEFPMTPTIYKASVVSGAGRTVHTEQAFPAGRRSRPSSGKGATLKCQV